MLLVRRAILGALVLPAVARAQSQAPSPWPDRPVRVFVPVPPGAAPDLVAREVADHLSRRLGQPFPVENRPGADGLLGVEALLAARPGEALLVSPAGALTLVPVLRNPPLPADPLDTVTPVAGLASDVIGLFAAPDQTGSLAEVVARARAAGAGRYNWFASPGPPALVMRGFLREAGLEAAEHVSYRGVPPALLDLSAGRLQLLFVPLAGALPLVRDGRARLLAVASASRAAAVPETPTGAEAGFPALRQDGLIALFGWRGMPAATAALLAEEAQAAMASVRDRLAARGQVARTERLEAFGALLRADRMRLAALARDFPSQD